LFGVHGDQAREQARQMSPGREDRLWKLEGDSGKVEVYVTDYSGSQTRTDGLRCEVLVRSLSFAGSYHAGIRWQGILEFGQACRRMLTAMESAASGDSGEGGALAPSLAELSPAHSPSLFARVLPSGPRRVRWDISCKPAPISDCELLTLSLSTEYQLLSSILTGAQRMWVKWPGPRILGQPAGMACGPARARR
jgi:hypothetical protein